MKKEQKTRQKQNKKNDKQIKKQKMKTKVEKEKEKDQKQEKIENQSQAYLLYKILDLQKTASVDQIKKQYKRLVLVYHPDKNKSDPDARQKFQKLKQAYDILSDPDKRKQYDETGSVGEQFNQTAFQSAYEYFRAQFKKVTQEDIDTFAKQYRGGLMEEEDLLDYYHQHEGNMTELLQCIPLSETKDIERFIKFYEDKIQKKEIKKYKSFDKTKNKVKNLVDESEQFEKLQREQRQQKEKDMDSLVMAIRQKQGKGDFIANLQAKYGQKKAKDNKKNKQKIQK